MSPPIDDHLQLLYSQPCHIVATHKLRNMATSFVDGGYELDFVDVSVAEEYQCPICLLVIKQPMLTSCCGYHFCKNCIKPILDKSSPCPMCKSGRFTVLLNKHHQRKIEELTISCLHKKAGCEWTGPLSNLRDHLDKKCLHVKVECTNKCGEHVLRKELAEHLEESCRNRQQKCIYCDFEDTFEEVEKHLDVCSSYPVVCPNSCNIGSVDRCCIEQHLSVCPLQHVECDFNHAGCMTTLRRKDLPAHMNENVQEHLLLLSSSLLKLSDAVQYKDKQIEELRGELQSKDKEISLIQQEMENLVRLVPIVPIEVTMENYRVLKASDAEWNSTPFYTHHRGYKMCLRVLPNGFLNWQKSHTSMFVCMMKGEFDDELRWPFVAKVVVQLLNQHNEFFSDDEHYEKELICKLPRVFNRAIGGGQGCCDFISNASLSNPKRGRDFLKFDRLHFRIASIELPLTLKKTRKEHDV